MTTRRAAVVLLLGLMLGLTPEANGQPPGRQNDADRAAFLSSYVGRYGVTETFVLDVSRVGDALYVRAPGQRPAQLRPRSETEFIIVGSSLRLIFAVDPVTGAVDHLVFEQGGFGRRAERLDTAAQPDARQALILPPDALGRYVGTYEEQPGFSITVSLVGGRLVAGFTGEEPQLIVPASEVEFFYEHSTARLSFDLGDDDQATGLVLHQGGSDVSMSRLAD